MSRDATQRTPPDGRVRPPTAAPGHEPVEPGPYASDLTIAERLFQRGCDFDFFQAVRLLEALYPDRRPVGHGGPPDAEALQFRAQQSLDFPPSAVCQVEPGEQGGPAATVEVAFMGLTGTSGVLPRHYTELLLETERDRKDPEKGALREWLDLFHHRFVSLFYRAWEKYRFWLRYTRREPAGRELDTFTTALYSLIGMANPACRSRLRVSRSRPRNALEPERVLAQIEDLSLLYYGGLLSQRPRCAVNLRLLLQDYFQVPVDVRQFQGQWLVIEPPNQTRLQPLDGCNQLGETAFVGDRVWDVGGKLCVRLGPLSYRQFLAFLPSLAAVPERTACFLLCHLVRFFVGPSLDFDLQLTLAAEEVPEMQLSDNEAQAAKLGWNTWLRDQPFQRVADDAVIGSHEIRWLE